MGIVTEILGKDGLKIVSLNRRKAIRERCLNCSAWSPKEVKNCKFASYPKDTEGYCRLLPYRSGKGKQDAKQRAIDIRKYCLWCCAGQRNEVRLCVTKDCPLFPYRQTKIDRTYEIV
jgi:hypothetical protein